MTPKEISQCMDRLFTKAESCPNGFDILSECVALAEMLIDKNVADGDSALSPVNGFAHGLDPEAQIRVRLDDNLSRLARGQAAGEDVIKDLLGYLILLRLARQKKSATDLTL